MYKLQVQDDDADTTAWHDVRGPDGSVLTFTEETEARKRLEQLYPVYVKMERYTGPKRTRVIRIWNDEDDDDGTA